MNILFCSLASVTFFIRLLLATLFIEELTTTITTIITIIVIILKITIILLIILAVLIIERLVVRMTWITTRGQSPPVLLLLHNFNIIIIIIAVFTRNKVFKELYDKQWWLAGGGIYIREVLTGTVKMRGRQKFFFFCKKNKGTDYERSHCNIDVGGGSEVWWNL